MAEESNEKFWQFLETVKELAIYKQTGRWCAYFKLEDLYFLMFDIFVFNGKGEHKCLIGLVNLNIKFEKMF